MAETVSFMFYVGIAMVGLYTITQIVVWSIVGCMAFNEWRKHRNGR